MMLCFTELYYVQSFGDMCLVDVELSSNHFILCSLYIQLYIQFTSTNMHSNVCEDLVYVCNILYSGWA